MPSIASSGSPMRPRHRWLLRLAAGSLLVIGGGSMLTAAPSPAPGSVARASQAGLLAAEDRLFAAQASHDLTSLAAGFADEALFMHANGMAQSKTEFLAAVRSDRLPYKSVSAEGRVARVSGDLGVTRGTMHLVVGDMHLSGTYLAAWVLRDGRWQLLDWQSTPPLQPRTP